MNPGRASSIFINNFSSTYILPVQFSFTLLGPAPAIPRLKIGPYQFATECLSGDAQAGNATSFPMSIGMVSRT